MLFKDVYNSQAGRHFLCQDFSRNVSFCSAISPFSHATFMAAHIRQAKEHFSLSVSPSAAALIPQTWRVSRVSGFSSHMILRHNTLYAIHVRTPHGGLFWIKRPLILALPMHKLVFAWPLHRGVSTEGKGTEPLFDTSPFAAPHLI